jgi:NAD(P)-dependent dehydrogenase (short-subunit alcohol dehydrogenase family)
VNSKQLIGRVALVTGGTRGIGLSIVKRFVNEGARVFITGRKADALNAAVAECGGDATGVQGDAASLDDLDRVYARIREEVGHLDIVVANAGSGAFLPLGAITEEHFDGIFALNVKGVVFTVQKALPLLRDGGSIVLISSITGSKGTRAFSIYSASKAAVRAFARNWLLDLAPRRIRVNVVSPGPTETPGLTGLAKDEEHAQQIKSHLASAIPLGRLGRSDEVANAALFLACDESSFVNGVDLAVDGGTSQI